MVNKIEIANSKGKVLSSWNFETGEKKYFTKGGAVMFDWVKEFVETLNVKKRDQDRIHLLLDEVYEYQHAVWNGKPKHKKIHELIDVIYVAMGSIMLDITPEKAAECFEAVHKANMAKVIVNGELVKPAGWKKANIKEILGENDD